MKEEFIISPEEKLEAWGLGPWVNEPDFIEFEHLGYNCEVLRIFIREGGSLCLGHLCGYVILNKEHPYFGFHYDEIEIDCHGGLTYSEMESDGHYHIGFDCCHAGDHVPSITSMMTDEFQYKFIEHTYLKEIEYRTAEFVMQECKKIVEQLIEKKNEMDKC